MMYSAQPRLIVTDPDAAIAYYQAAMGAVVDEREAIDDGTVVHARLRAGSAVFTLAAEVADWGLLAPGSIGGSATLDVDDAARLSHRKRKGPTCTD